MLFPRLKHTNSCAVPSLRSSLKLASKVGIVCVTPRTVTACDELGLLSCTLELQAFKTRRVTAFRKNLVSEKPHSQAVSRSGNET